MQTIRRVALVFTVLALSGCAKEDELTAEQKVCAIGLYPQYSAKRYDECVKVCTVCKKGNTVTCSTSCKLRGAG